MFPRLGIDLWQPAQNCSVKRSSGSPKLGFEFFDESFPLLKEGRAACAAYLRISSVDAPTPTPRHLAPQDRDKCIRPGVCLDCDKADLSVADTMA